MKGFMKDDDNDDTIRTKVFFFLFSKLQLIIDIFFYGCYSVTMNITKENCIRDADVRDWSVGGVICYKLPVFFEGNAMTLFTNNWSMTNMNERPHDDVNVVWINKRDEAKTNGFVFVGRMNARGGMQDNKTNNESNDTKGIDNNRCAKEIELLMIFFE
ncbi:hypothetical protein RFI_37052 [Reticulomyxa filosa]|uniref:Uncharacterized protein n=1 Tax=Reticulomyxa filosa TaxID=46433 RepID=X6LI84_RETFI|nr:hypothetical protein RFI_37052 [Reticulomyxa filosa]|eukprot:ETO00395.1 hypothetical protein RFI_37052 [Reticulomyxa filosa]